MPKKVSSITLEDRANLTDAYQVLVTNPNDYSLYRVPVPNFRGASVFVSTNLPTDTPEDSLIPSYVEGDVFIHETAEGHNLYIWNNTNGEWEDKNKLNGIRILTAEDFPDETGLDKQTSNFLSNLAYEGDYYLNKTYNLLYGPYSDTNGFLFENRTLQGYESFRRPETFLIEVADAAAYDDLATSLETQVTNLTGVDDEEAIRLQRPVTTDIYHLKRSDDSGHGGYYYSVNSTLATNNDPSFYVNLTDAVSGATKQHYRDSTTFNLDTAPVQDDTKYREGDNVLDVSRGVLYYGYNEGIAATTDLGVLFDGQTTLSGSSLKNTRQSDGSWLEATANDSEYADGDFLLTESQGTPRIHGPYKTGAGSDKIAWPLFAVLRSPVKHVALDDTALVESFDAASYPAYDNVMIVDGDTWEKVYKVTDLADADEDTKRVELSQGVTIDYTGLTLDWGVTTRNSRPSKFWKQAAITQPTKDDETYYTDDYIITGDATVYGPYKEGQTTHAEAWPVFMSLTANKTVKVVDAAADFEPSQTNSDSSWGGSAIVKGDGLIAYFASTTTGKIKEYLAEDVEVGTNNITWKELDQANFTYYQDTLSWPSISDKDYHNGDYIENKSGIKFGPYVEGATDQKVALPYESVSRSPKDFYLTGFDFSTEDVNTYLPSTSSISVANFGAEYSGMMVVVGDKFYFINGDKSEYYIVTSVDYTGDTCTLSGTQSAKQSIIHNDNSTGIPSRNDNVYGVGDFIINANAVMYGPYVSGQTSDADAWPVKSSLRDNIGVIADSGTIDAGVNWKIVVENGILKLEDNA